MNESTCVCVYINVCLNVFDMYVCIYRLYRDYTDID